MAVLQPENDLCPSPRSIEMKEPIATLLVSKDTKFDLRRSLNPEELQDESSKCICQLALPKMEVGAASCLMIDLGLPKALFMSRPPCCPEPDERNFIDWFEMIHALRAPALGVISLHGSGASVPQHFHGQLFPCSKIHLALVNNIREVAGTATRVCGIRCSDITAPMAGLQLTFPDSSSATEMGRALFRALQCGVRLGSQLRYSYNLCIQSERPRVASIFPRQAVKESPFLLPQILNLIAEKAGPRAAHCIAESPNRAWRWGWRECLGGLQARDDSFIDPAVFDGNFWRQVYQVMGLDSQYRAVVRRRIEDMLQDC